MQRWQGSCDVFSLFDLCRRKNCFATISCTASDCCTRLTYRSLKKIDSEHCNLLQLNIALKISEYQQQQEVVEEEQVDEEEEEEEENMLDLLLH
jgi:hypothetical protein